MHVKTITIGRAGSYSFQPVDPSKPLLATVEVEGQIGTVKINLPVDVSAKIVALIAGELADAARIAAEAMTAQFIAVEASSSALVLA